MAEKQVEIDPPEAADAGCDATCVEDEGAAYITEYTAIRHYKLQLTKIAFGWRFKRFEYVWNLREDGYGSESENKVWEYPSITLHETYMNMAALEIGPGEHITWHSDIHAIFERITPTYRLVNSAEVEAPAKLVYDPKSGLLVRDS